MLARQRQARIVDEVRRHGGVRVSDLTSLLEVSDMTVRRDLEELERQGLLQKVHGGARTPEQQRRGTGLRGEVGPGAAGEARAGRGGRGAGPARSGAGHQRRHHDPGPGGHAVRGAGHHGGHQLGPGGRGVRAGRAVSGRTVMLTGGVRTPSDALVGPLADAAIRSLHVDVLFLGVHGMHPVAGFTTPNLAEAETNRAFLAHAQKVIVVADHTKWRTVGLASFGPLSAADVLITDDGLDREARMVLDEAVGELIVAPVGHARREGGRRGRGVGAVTAYRSETRLADGRVLYYFDAEPGVVRDAVDERDLPVTTTASEIRWDPLADQWVVIASHRQGRTFLPPADECPLDPSRDGGTPRSRPRTTRSWSSRTGSRRCRPRPCSARTRTTCPTTTRCSPARPGSAGARSSASPATTRPRSPRCRRSGSGPCWTPGSTAPPS